MIGRYNYLQGAIKVKPDIQNEEKSTFIERPVSYKTHDGILIDGIITSPDKPCNKSLPGIVLVHGSAPLDMDGSWPAYFRGIPQTFNGNEVKNFKMIAEHLSRNGYTVIRANKRGVTKTITDVNYDIYKTSSYTNLLHDLNSKIEILKTESNIDKFILLGWSEGTILSSKIAQMRSDVIGMILMGDVGSSFKELIRHFYKTEKEFQEEISLIEKMPDYEMAGLDRPAIRIKELFRDISNAERIEKLKIPILVLHGKIDVETPVSEAFLVKKAIDKNNNPRSKVIIYETFGHGFAPHLGDNNEIKTEGPFDESVLTDIKIWLNSNYKDI